jgi:hypothetical protein
MKNRLSGLMFASAFAFAGMVVAGRSGTPAFAQTTTSCLQDNGGEICRTVQTCTAFDTRSMQCGQWTTVYYRLPLPGGGGGSGSGMPMIQ